MEKPDMTKKQAIGVYVVAGILFLLGAAALIVAAVLQGRGYGSLVTNPVGFGAFALWIASLATLLGNVRGLFGVEVRGRFAKLNGTPSSSFVLLSSPEAMKKAFLDLSFKPAGRALSKIRFSFFHDYLVMIAYVVEITDLQATLAKIASGYEELITTKRRTAGRNNILYLIMYVAEATEQDAALVKAFAMNQIMIQTTIPRATNVIIPILYDGLKQCFIFLDRGAKSSLKTYDVGLRYFQKNILAR